MQYLKFSSGMMIDYPLHKPGGQALFNSRRDPAL